MVAAGEMVAPGQVQIDSMNAKVGGKVRLSVDGRAAPPLENPSGASGKGGKLARRFAANLGGTGRMDNKVETLERILHSSKVLGAALQPLAAALP